MQGTELLVNKAMMRPLLIGGCEKTWLMVNALICFPLCAASHCNVPALCVGVLVFMLLHGGFVMLTKHDPHLSAILKRATRYLGQDYYPAISHPTCTPAWPIKSVSRPR